MFGAGLGLMLAVQLSSDDFLRGFRSVNTNFFFNFTDIFLISPTSDPSDFLPRRAVHTVRRLH